MPEIGEVIFHIGVNKFLIVPALAEIFHEATLLTMGYSFLLPECRDSLGEFISIQMELELLIACKSKVIELSKFNAYESYDEISRLLLRVKEIPAYARAYEEAAEKLRHDLIISGMSEEDANDYVNRLSRTLVHKYGQNNLKV